MPGRFKNSMLKSKQDYSTLRWAVDNEADFQLVSIEPARGEDAPKECLVELRKFADDNRLTEAHVIELVALGIKRCLNIAEAPSTSQLGEGEC